MLADLYVLTAQRSTVVADSFKEAWLASFQESAREYEFPQYSEAPIAVYRSVTELIHKLIECPNEPHAIYWQNPKDELLRNAMLFFTTDGAMVAGLTIGTTDATVLARHLEALARSVGGRFGYCAFEQPPPETAVEFLETVRDRPPPKLADGVVVT